MRFYLAGKFADRELLHQKMVELEALGFENTLDWTQVEKSKERTQEHLAQVAEKDIEAIHDAHVTIAVMDDPKYPYRGTFTEIGASLSSDTPVILICPNPEKSSAASNVFFHHPNIYHVQSWEEAKGCLDLIQWYRTKF